MGLSDVSPILLRLRQILYRYLLLRTVYRLDGFHVRSRHLRMD